MAETVADVLAGCATGTWSAPVALLRLAASAASEAEAREALAAALGRGEDGAGRLAELDRLWRRRPEAFWLVREVLARAAHDRDDRAPDAALARWRAVFDGLAEDHPDAAMALYALDDPAMLARATSEVATLAFDWARLRPGDSVLDLGCGTGRVAAELAERGADVVGLDLSEGLLRVARRRHTGLPLVRTDGRSLAALRDRSFDAVVVVDVMPYAVQAGGDVAAVLLAEIGRVLRPGGRAVLVNWSYADPRAGPELDGSRLVVERGPERPFRLWDGQAWALRSTP